jgi:hypothetical protein
MSTQRSTFQSTSYSYSSSTVNGVTTSKSESVQTDPSGTRIHRTSQNQGERPIEERIEYDNTGRRLQDAGASQGRIEDVTDKEEQAEKDRQYEEKMEDEYAKREGGA